MPKLRVSAFTISLDGFGAGPDQSLKNPLGVGGETLHPWMVPTRTFQSMFGNDGETGVDDDFARASMEGVGAWIMGRNMFAHSRGPWTEDGWKGWWGENPVYHCPVFVLTHHARAPIEMQGGTTFHFVTDGIHAALDRAKAAAGPKDVRVGGGAATVRQYLAAGLVDEMHLVVSPVLLGRGERLFDGTDLASQGFKVARTTATAKATHYVLRKAA
ncbi:MAG: dihydrofolate reductase family protein [Rhodospirillaceae bacterium]|nr:dihydrofolate reductase family protein [Rhodospirillaceae bacterium]